MLVGAFWGGSSCGNLVAGMNWQHLDSLRQC